MIARLIYWSIHNRFLVLIATVLLAAWGVLSLIRTPLDALPDLSDTQVIIRTTWPGQAPQLVENQVTYPLTTTMLSVPGARVVRGYSFFGDSYVYVLFKDGTDLIGPALVYWNTSARSNRACPPARRQHWGRMQPASAGFTNMPSSTKPVSWIYPNCVACKTGF